MNQNKKLLTLAFFLLLPFTFNMVSCSCENSSISPPTPPLPPPGTSDFPTEALNANDDPDLTHMTPGENPVVALKSDGNPIVSWVEKDLPGGTATRTYKIYCWSWNGRTWDHLPADTASARQGFNGGNGEFSLNSLNLKLGSDNLPVIAWQEKDNGPDNTPTTYIKKWNGSAWVNYGSSPELNARTDLGSNAGVRPSLVLDNSNNPIVAWIEQESASIITRRLYIQKWDGTSWQNFGTSSEVTIWHPTQIFEAPALTLRNNQPVYVMSKSGADAPGLTVNQWNNTDNRWDNIVINHTANGSMTTTPPGSTLASLTTKPDNDLVMTWWEGITDSTTEPTHPFTRQNFYTYQFNQLRGWSALGPNQGRTSNFNYVAQEVSGTRSYLTSPAVDPMQAATLLVDRSNAPIVAWSQEDGVHISRFNSTHWTEITGSPFKVSTDTLLSQLASAKPSIAYDATRNAIVLVWSEGDSNSNPQVQKVYIRRISL